MREIIDRILIILFLSILAYALIFIALDLPPFGLERVTIGDYYLENSLREVGATNTVNAILWDYRGYDTLGETIVLFTAVVVITNLLSRVAK